MLKPLFSMGSAVMSSPLYSIVPASASTRPRIRFKSVVFPQPEGPRMETISPSPISRLIFSRTVRPSYVFFKFSSFNIPFSFLFPCFVLRLIIATECIKKRYVKPKFTYLLCKIFSVFLSFISLHSGRRWCRSPRPCCPRWPGTRGGCPTSG